MIIQALAREPLARIQIGARCARSTPTHSPRSMLASAAALMLKMKPPVGTTSDRRRANVYGHPQATIDDDDDDDDQSRCRECRSDIEPAQGA
jgi:hypothetical protein